MSRHEWMDDANCAGVDTDLFYVKKGTKSRAAAKAAARTYCGTCPVAAECLAAELPFGSSGHHVRAGRTPDRIGRIATAQRKQATL